MASAKVVLFTSKTLSNGAHPIMLRLIHNRQTKYFYLNASCHPDFWDEETKMPKRKHPHFRELSVLIDTKRLEAQKLIIDLESDGGDYSLEELCKRLSADKRRNQTTVLQYFDEVIERLRKGERLGYAAVFVSTRNYLSKFRGGKDFTFPDITTSFIVRFDEYLSMSGMKPNSVFVPMRTFKTLVNSARKEDLVKEDFNPFKDFSFTKYRRDKPHKRAILREEIRKIEHLELTPGTQLYLARDYFIFIYYCAGINFIDLAYLKKENIRDNRLIYIRRKTKEMINVVLLPPAQQILSYYQEQHSNSEGYLFPILNETHASAESKDYRIDKVLKQVNKALKTLAEQAGIAINLTTYVARHSFATNMKSSGVSTAIISQALGHESERTTQIYLDSFGNTIMDEAMKSIL